VDTDSTIYSTTPDHVIARATFATSNVVDMATGSASRNVQNTGYPP
jgi:hypothetical protein